MVTNNVDVIDFDVKELTVRVDTLNAEMGQTRTIMKYMQEDIQTNRIIASTALAFSVVGGFSQIGMQLFPNGINFAAQRTISSSGQGIGGWLKGIYSKIHSWFRETGYSQIPTLYAEYLSLRGENKTSINAVLAWCEEPYIEMPEEPINELDTEEMVPSLTATYEICNQFRESLKPAFLKLAKRISEIDVDLEAIDNAIENNYIAKSDLTRDDINDIICSLRTKYIILTAEDTINDGVIEVKIFVSGEDPLIFSITFEDNQITEFKGVDETAETFRTEHLNKITLNDKVIMIETNTRITGATIESNTCARRMNHTTTDLAYIQDIQALDEKITALAEQSHANDLDMYAQYYTKDESDEKYALKSDVVNVDLSEYATVDEVNEVLTENYRQKNDLTIKRTKYGLVQLPVETKKWEAQYCTTSHIEFHEGAHLVGFLANYPTADFDVIFKTESIQNDTAHQEIHHIMIITGGNDRDIRLVWEETTGALGDTYGTYPITITKAEYEGVMEYIDDELALKSDLSDYRKYNDLAVNTVIDLPIEHKVPEGAYDFDGETAHVEFHEGAQLEGYAIAYNSEINDFVHRDFSITFHTEGNDKYRHAYNTIISEEVEGFWWDERTNAFYAGGDVEIAVHLNSAKLITEDKLVLKSEYDAKIAALEARLAALENA